MQQLRQEAGGHAATRLLEQWIAEEAMTPQEATTARATERMAITQVVMANSITSLRAVGRMEWRTFVEAAEPDRARCYGTTRPGSTAA